MEKRKIKGIGFGITSIVFAIASVVLFTTEVTPDFVPILIDAIAMVAALFGFKVEKPEDVK